MEERKYEYGGKWSIIIIGIISFGGAALFFYFEAVKNNKGLILNGLLELDAIKATIFYWTLFTLSLLFVLMGLTGLYFKIKKKEYLLLKTDKIIIPPVGFRRKRTEILFSDIKSIEETQINSNTILTLKFTGGTRGILSNLLPNKREYEYIKLFIIEKISETKEINM